VGYEFDDRGDSIRLYGTDSTQSKSKDKSKDGEKAASEGYVGKISIPMDGGKYYIEFMLRESDLTDELKNLRTEKMKEILGKLSKND
jgi:hypothetical protein